MEAETILEQLKTSTDTPHGWIVFPLLRNKVIVGILGWALGVVLGLGLFALIALSTIPDNLQRGFGPALLTVIMLALMLFIGLGSAWSLFVDVQRLLHADKHVIVITPEEFVKQEGEKIIQVPLTYVRHVTARGAPPPDRTASGSSSTARDLPGAGENVLGFFVGRSNTPAGIRQRRKRMRTPTTLAFVDERTDREVVVIADKSHGDPFMIAALLKQYAANAQQQVIR